MVLPSSRWKRARRKRSSSRGRAGGPVQAPGHPQVDGERLVRVEADQQVLAAAPDRGDAPAHQARDHVLRLLGAHELRVEAPRPPRTSAPVSARPAARGSSRPRAAQASPPPPSPAAAGSSDTTMQSAAIAARPLAGPVVARVDHGDRVALADAVAQRRRAARRPPRGRSTDRRGGARRPASGPPRRARAPAWRRSGPRAARRRRSGPAPSAARRGRSRRRRRRPAPPPSARRSRGPRPSRSAAAASLGALALGHHPRGLGEVAGQRDRQLPHVLRPPAAQHLGRLAHLEGVADRARPGGRPWRRRSSATRRPQGSARAAISAAASSASPASARYAPDPCVTSREIAPAPPAIARLMTDAATRPAAGVVPVASRSASSRRPAGVSRVLWETTAMPVSRTWRTNAGQRRGRPRSPGSPRACRSCPPCGRGRARPWSRPAPRAPRRAARPRWAPCRRRRPSTATSPVGPRVASSRRSPEAISARVRASTCSRPSPVRHAAMHQAAIRESAAVPSIHERTNDSTLAASTCSPRRVRSITSTGASCSAMDGRHSTPAARDAGTVRRAGARGGAARVARVLRPVTVASLLAAAAPGGRCRRSPRRPGPAPTTTAPAAAAAAEDRLAAPAAHDHRPAGPRALPRGAPPRDALQGDRAGHRGVAATGWCRPGPTRRRAPPVAPTSASRRSTARASRCCAGSLPRPPAGDRRPGPRLPRRRGALPAEADRRRTACSTPTPSRCGGRSGARPAPRTPGQLVAVVGVEGDRRRRRPATRRRDHVGRRHVGRDPRRLGHGHAGAARRDARRHRVRPQGRAGLDDPRQPSPTGRPRPTTRSRSPSPCKREPRSIAYAVAQARQLVDTGKLTEARALIAAWPARVAHERAGRARRRPSCSPSRTSGSRRSAPTTAPASATPTMAAAEYGRGAGALGARQGRPVARGLRRRGAPRPDRRRRRRLSTPTPCWPPPTCPTPWPRPSGPCALDARYADAFLPFGISLISERRQGRGRQGPAARAGAARGAPTGRRT